MPRFIVLKGSRPQSRRVCNRPGVRSGVLVDGEPVTVFANRRQARRAIDRTEDAKRKLSDPVCKMEFRDDPQFASLFSEEPWTVVPVEILNPEGLAVSDVVLDTTPDPITPETPLAVTEAGRALLRRSQEPELFTS